MNSIKRIYAHRHTSRAARKLYELTNYGLATIRWRIPKTRFIFWAHARCGSHLFADLISSHPNIECITEETMFYKTTGVFRPKRYIEGVSVRSQHPVFGGKVSVMDLHSQRGRDEDIVHTFHQAGWKFITLIRENVLETAISSEVARQRQQYQDTKPVTLADMRINIDLAILHRKLNTKQHVIDRTHALIAPYEPLPVCYERDLLGTVAQQQMANRVFNFLGLPDHPATTKYVKTNTYALSDYVTNYAEVVASLRGTPFERHLPEEISK